MNSMQLEQQTLLTILYYMKLAREVETLIERKLFHKKQRIKLHQC